MRERLVALSNSVTSVLALVGAVGILAMLVHVCVYVVSRHVIATPIPGTIEIVSRYYMITLALLPLAWVDRRGDMISVEIFAPLLAGRLKTVSAAFVITLTGVAYAALTYTTWFKAMREFGVKSFVVSANSIIAVWPTYFVLPVAFAIASLVCLLKLYLVFTGPVGGEDPPRETVPGR